MIDLKELIKAGVHFGHQTWRWCPKMKPYIWGSRNSVHLIDVSKTARAVERAAKFLEEVAASGKPILWVGTKKPAQKAVLDVATKLDSPYVTHRWIGGTLTNYPQVKKSITKLLHLEDVLAKVDEHMYTKKERGRMQKMVDRSIKNVGGIRTLRWPVGALVVVDARRENTAIREAVVAGVPVVALVDTNTDPSLVTHVIPANDDIPRSISLLLGYLGDAVERGKAKAKPAKSDEEVVTQTLVETLVVPEGDEVSDTVVEATADKAKKATKKAEPKITPAAKASVKKESTTKKESTKATRSAATTKAGATAPKKATAAKKSSKPSASSKKSTTKKTEK